MPPRKKGKKANNYIVPKWTSDGFGSYSLVLETVNKPTSTTENKKNNQVKSLLKKKGKIS